MVVSNPDSQELLQELEELSPAMIKQVLLFTRFLKSQSPALTTKPIPTVAGSYDFSDLVGKLTWQGDAVAIQRELRDEW